MLRHTLFKLPRPTSVLDIPAGVASVPAELASLSYEFAPLRTTDEVAQLALAMAAIPDGVPGRADRVLARLSNSVSSVARLCSGHVTHLLASLQQHATLFLRLVGYIRPEYFLERSTPILLVPPVQCCVACNGVLTDVRRGATA